MIRRKKFVTPTEIHSKRDDNQFVDCGYTNKVLLWSTHEEKFAIIHRANEKKRTAHNLKTTYRKKKLHCYTALNGKSKLSAICRRTKAREIFVITMRMSVMRVEGEGGKTHPSFRAFSYITTTSPDDIRKKNSCLSNIPDNNTKRTITIIIVVVVVGRPKAIPTIFIVRLVCAPLLCYQAWLIDIKE